MNKLLESFLQEETIRSLPLEYTKLFGSPITIDKVLAILFIEVPGSYASFSTTLQKVLCNPVATTNAFKNFIKIYENLNEWELELLEPSRSLIWSKNFDLQKVMNNSDLYDFHKDLPISFMRIVINRKYNHMNEEYRFYQELLRDYFIGVDEGEKNINIFTDDSVSTILYRLLVNGESSFSDDADYTFFSSGYHYYFNGVGYEVFRETFGTFKNLPSLLIELGKVAENERVGEGFDMKKFCLLSDSNLPFDWNVELHLIECLN